jgi:mannose-6-phosphate isomerase-like protein (cupin superfamily)
VARARLICNPYAILSTDANGGLLPSPSSGWEVGCDSLASLHLHTFDQFYYVLSGTMQLQIGLEKFTAGRNTYVLLPAGVPHRNWNDGPEIERHLNLQVPEMLPAPEADPPVVLP